MTDAIKLEETLEAVNFAITMLENLSSCSTLLSQVTANRVLIDKWTRVRDELRKELLQMHTSF